MMNIAILIGISKYQNVAQLPACSIDVEHMNDLLTATEKYDDILCLTENTKAGQLKDELRAFFSKHRSNSINEALIYFSGHGVYHSDALLCCSDFEIDRPSTTSLSNSELDDLLRSVSPEVAIKIIDACQSGSPYIKDAGDSFKKSFKKCQLNAFICMASSRVDQSSYATANASAFTAKWIDSALHKDAGDILYRDIQAALADAFVNTPEQTPFFVNQGTGLEIFCTVTQEVRRLTNLALPSAGSSGTKNSTLDALRIEIIRKDSAYVSQDEAFKSIEVAGEELTNSAINSSLVQEFYTKTVSLGDKLGTLPRIGQLAAFAKEQGWSKKFFVKITSEEYKVRVRPHWNELMRSYAQNTGLKQRVEDVFETRIRPGSLESTQPLPFEVAELQFEAPNHPSLPSFAAYIGIVHSLTEVMVLSSVGRLSQKGWTRRSPELSEIQWRS